MSKLEEFSLIFGNEFIMHLYTQFNLEFEMYYPMLFKVNGNIPIHQLPIVNYS